MRDYYALLGIDATAKKADVKKNYRKLVTQFHPDKNSAADAASKFIAITEAYEVLSDTKRRAHYDLSRWEAKKRKQAIEQDFTIVKAPQESLRTRRRKAQQKRGLAFQQAGSDNQWFSLLTEGFFVSGRYIFHCFGVILGLLIFYSAISQITDAFQISAFVGLGICVFVVAILYWTFRLVKHTFYEIIQEIKSVSVLFSITEKRAKIIIISAFISMILMMLFLIKLLL